MKSSWIPVLSLAAGLWTSSHALADARTELLAAFAQTFAAGEKLRAQMLNESGGAQLRMTTEMVLPDRFRTTNDRGEFLILPEGAWMRAAGGKDWQKFEINPASMSAAYTPEGFRQMREAMREVKALGAEAVDGRPAQRFAWHADTEYMGIRASSDNVAWVADDCRCIVRMQTSAVSNGQTGTTTITYERLADLAITPPAGIQ